MNKELEDKIFERFPRLFPNGRNVDPRISLISYGLDCGDGWYNLIWDLCLKLENKPITVTQVKQKYGFLRFYVDYKAITDEEFTYVLNTIADTEELSSSTCEICGNEGKLRTDKIYIQTLCDEHAKLRGEQDEYNKPIDG